MRPAGGRGRLPEDMITWPRAGGVLSRHLEFPQLTAHPRLACPALGTWESQEDRAASSGFWWFQGHSRKRNYRVEYLSRGPPPRLRRHPDPSLLSEP